MCLIQNKILSNSFVFFFLPHNYKSFLRNDWQLDFQFHRFQREIKFLLVEPCILHELMHFICYAIFLLLEHIFSRILSVCLFIFSVTLFFCLFVSTTDNNRTANTISEIQEICYNLRQCFRKDKIIKENVGDRGGITQKSNKMSAIEWSLHIKYTL